ncbi:MAG: 1-acyl-sn-glycerol-3-phosphate acyltransferase [Pelagimonas sp.]|nr:1-acyl-sn-glycerol-3-phosphate acyltransferase [Pelagimonas sp.]
MQPPVWDPATTAPAYRVTGPGWLRVAVRAPLMALVNFGGLLLLLALRVIERPLFGAARPITPYITQAVCRLSLRIMRLPMTIKGKPMRGQGVVVANHSSWLDIYVLNSRKNIYFVSKAEVANWPGIGWLARATGTVFIKRDPREAKAQTALFRERLGQGHRLLFFPEGTSTDATRVLPFKPTLFQAFFDESLRDTLRVQAVSVVYHAPMGEDARYYGWWGDMEFASSLLKMLSTRRHGRIELVYHAPVRVDDFSGRKPLALALEAQVRQGMEAARAKDPSDQSAS